MTTIFEQLVKCKFLAKLLKIDLICFQEVERTEWINHGRKHLFKLVLVIKPRSGTAYSVR